MKVFVTGATGFVGKHLMRALHAKSDVIITDLECADIVFHLAGVTGTATEQKYEDGNAKYTQSLCSRLTSIGRAPKIIFASSLQIHADTPYGRSKLRAEQCLWQFSRQNPKMSITIFRWPNIFGGGGKPNHNSVVATFCYNIAHGLPIQMSDPFTEIPLLYIDNVVAQLLAELCFAIPGISTVEVSPAFRITLQDLAEKIQSFRDAKETRASLDLSCLPTKQLFATYVSYQPQQ